MNINYMMTTIDTHVVGEAIRVFLQVPPIFKGITLEENNRISQTTFYQYKQLILSEPRGHRGIKGCIILPSKVADFSIIFLDHSHEKMPFSYSSLIGATTALLETGNLSSDYEVYKIETIQGIYQINMKKVEQSGQKFTLTTNHWQILDNNHQFTKVKSKENRIYYMYSLPKDIQAIKMEYVMELQKWGIQKSLEHMKEDGEFASVIIYEQDKHMHQKYRAVTFEKDGYILRSPGIETTLAMLAKLTNERKINKKITIESIFNQSFQASVNNNKFVVEGNAYFIGTRQLVYDETDPFPTGFLIK